MLIKLLRQVFSPLKRFSKEPSYRHWLRLADQLKTVPPETTSVINTDGLTIHFSDAPALLNMYENIFVNQCYRFIPSNTKPVIIDCGANIGISVLWFAKQYPDAFILAFEPDDYLFSLLKRNTNANNIMADLRNQAVWTEGKELKFSSGKRQNSKLSESGTTTVKGIRLKEVLAAFTRIDLLKLDIEGAEYEVIRDCRDELHRVNYLFVECHFMDGRISEVLTLLEILNQSGFQFSFQTPMQKNPFSAITGLHTLDVFASKV